MLANPCCWDISPCQNISYGEKIECVDSLIQDVVALLPNKVALLRKSNFPFLNAAKTIFCRKGNDRPTHPKLKRSKEVKTGTKQEFLDIIRCQKNRSRRHTYVGRLGQHITTTEIEQYSSTNDVGLLHVRQISKSEPLHKSFHCVFKFNDEKLNHPFSCPKTLFLKNYPDNTALEWLSCVDQKRLKDKMLLFSEKFCSFFS